MTLLRVEGAANRTDQLIDSVSVGRREICNEDTFCRMIAIERKRTERSKQPFLLMLVEWGQPHESAKASDSLHRIVTALLSSIRETDIIGWYKERTTVGVIFTGLVASNKNSISSMMRSKVSTALRDRLPLDQFNQVSISFHFFPDDWDDKGSGHPTNTLLYPDLFDSRNGRKTVAVVKRGMDIAGSVLMLTLCAPILAMIGLAIKLTSKGPVFFKQQRVGQYGQPFMFLKFRSMYVNNDNSVHKDFITKFIASEASKQPLKGNGEGVFKLTNDKRVTRVGKFLRRTSLDELPQFLNVMKGEMSLVGPRPPIPYELAAYQTWHRRRVLEVKPGITGLWQVMGRSRVNFDEMVRLDLRYATTWSPTLDLTILMRTPLAVIKGEGAM
jgi:lipopolysaccharide/colanic/teichoic acid biosynthesis glycosyltransferase